jgi:hypothetical protein
MTFYQVNKLNETAYFRLFMFYDDRLFCHPLCYLNQNQWKLRLRGRNIAFANSVIYLGIFLDPKLNWKQNLTERRKKFDSFMWACRRVMGKSCRINSNIAMWMYKTVLLPQILYASVVCWCVVSRVKAMNLHRSL